MAYDAKKLVRIAVDHLAVAPNTRLKSVASLCGVSRHTLARAFRVTMGLSYRQLRTVLLNQQSEALMAEGQAKSIKEVAVALGFARSDCYARWLARTAGVHPSERRLRRASTGQRKPLEDV